MDSQTKTWECLAYDQTRQDVLCCLFGLTVPLSSSFLASLGAFPLRVFRSVFRILWSVGMRARNHSCHAIPIGHTQEGQAAGVVVLPLSVRMVALKPRRHRVSARTGFSACEFVDDSKPGFLVFGYFTRVECFGSQH